MRGRPRKEIAVIHNKLARAQSDLSPLGMRIMVLLATRVSHDHDLLKHKLKVQEYKARLGLTGGSAYNTLEQVADEMLLGKAVPILADGVKVPLKFEKPIFTLRPASLHG